MAASSFDQFLTLKGLFLKDLLLKLENADLLVPELKAFFDDSIAKTEVTTAYESKREKKKREKKPPNQTQCRVGACYRLLVERAPDVSPKVRLGAASKMARFLKQRGCVVLDDRTNARLVDEAVSSMFDLLSPASDDSSVVPKDKKPSVQKPKANKDPTKSNDAEKETLKRLEEIERRAKARAEQESDEEESSDEDDDDDDDDSCPPEEALELVPESEEDD